MGERGRGGGEKGGVGVRGVKISGGWRWEER